MNIKKYQEYCLGVKVASAYSCADCLEIWEPKPPGTLGPRTGIALLLFKG
jgi:hypothetical protein